MAALAWALRSLRPGAAAAAAAGGHGRTRRGAGRAQLGPHRPQHPEEEQVQQRQQAQLEDEEQLVGHGALGRLEREADVAEAELVAVAQLLLGDPHAVDPGAVGGAEVDEHEAVAPRADLGVVAAHVGVDQGDVALGQAADGHGVLPQHEAVAGGQDERAGAAAAGALTEAGLDGEGAGALGWAR